MESRLPTRRKKKESNNIKKKAIGPSCVVVVRSKSLSDLFFRARLHTVDR